jgi:hypothetical protein
MWPEKWLKNWILLWKINFTKKWILLWKISFTKLRKKYRFWPNLNFITHWHMERTPWKLDILKMTFKITFKDHIDFISEIESSTCVKTVRKIWKLLKILFLRYRGYRPLNESDFWKKHWGYGQKSYEDGFQSLHSY